MPVDKKGRRWCNDDDDDDGDNGNDNDDDVMLMN